MKEEGEKVERSEFVVPSGRPKIGRRPDRASATAAADRWVVGTWPREVLERRLFLVDQDDNGCEQRVVTRLLWGLLGGRIGNNLKKKLYAQEEE